MFHESIQVNALLATVGSPAGEPWLLSLPRPLFCTALLVFTSWGLGRHLLNWIWPRGGSVSTAPFLATGLGAGAIAALVFLAGTVGWLAGETLYLLLVLAVIGASVTVSRSVRARTGAAKLTIPGAAEFLLVGLPLVAAGLWASIPPAFYDALVYHLGLPNRYLTEGSLVYPEAFSLAGYPQNAEMLLTMALGLGGEVSARLTGFVFTALAALLLRRLAIDRFGRVAGNLAYLLLVSQWFFWFQAVFLKVDLIGGFFLLAAIAVLFEVRDEDDARPWIVAGLLAGFAVGVKFTHLLPIGLATLSVPFVRQAGAKFRARHALLLIAIAVAVASPWMLRNAMHRGNPLFPAFYAQLGGTGWNDANAARMRAETGMNLDRSLSAGVQRVTQAGWDSGYGSGGELSRAWLPLLVAGVFLARHRQVRFLLGLALLGWVLGVVFFSTYLRVHAWALLVVPLAWCALWHRYRSTVSHVALCLVLAAIVGPGFYRAVLLTETVSAGGSRVWRGATTPDAYLVERINYTPVARYINESLDHDARIRVLGSARTAYIRRVCETTYVWDDPWVAPLIDDPSQARRMLAGLQRDGFTHVLLDTLEMERLEQGQQLYGYSARENGRVGIDMLLRTLQMEVEANGVYLFRVPSADG